MFVNLPTGFGKLPIYQLAPSIVEEMSRLDGKICSAIILVISCLVSLMKDQVQRTIFAAKRNKSYVYWWGIV